MGNNARGDNISAYSPPFSKGAKVYLGQQRGSQTTGAIISSGITYAVTHGLSGIPSLVVVGLRSTKALISGTATVGESSASARTSSKVYLVGEPHGIGYSMYSLL